MKNKNFAFTLIELLVTIVVLSVLAAISIATFNKYFGKANNSQRLVVVTEYIKAFKRMNASGEGFPITTNKSSGNYPSLVCLVSPSELDYCYASSRPIFYISDITERFDKHLSGMDNIVIANLSDATVRSGMWYEYPMMTSRIGSVMEQMIIDRGLNPKKTAIFQWNMNETDYPCDDIDGGVLWNGNFKGGTTCWLFIEDQM